MRTLIVSNASSGGAEEAVIAEVGRRFEDLGEATHLQPPSLEAFDEDVRRSSSDKDLIVVAGGDGTLNCTVNAISDRLDDVTLAVVPLGTGNDFARTLELPEDPLAAADAIADGVERQVDVCRAATKRVQRLFLNACMGGFPVEVNRAIDEDVKRRLGPLAFWVGGAKAAARLPRFEVTIGDERFDDVIAVGVGSGKTAGGGIPVFPSADPADGALECCVMHASTVLEAGRLAAKVRSGEHVDLDNVVTRSASSLEVAAEPELEFNVDGDLVGLVAPARFEVVDRVRVRVPRSTTKSRP